MKFGVACLILAYMFSQFYRVFLAVLSPVLQADTGASAQDLSLASGLWFLAFAAMQFPVGAALDRLGPRRTCGVLLGLGAGSGAVLVAGALGYLTPVQGAMLHTIKVLSGANLQRVQSWHHLVHG